MSSEIQNRSSLRRLDVLLALLLTVSAFAVRIDRIGFNSLSEDEVAKWQAVQEYQHGHFAGVNSEHPMMMKVLAWASLETGERWNRLASLHSWPSMSPEGWLRLPNVVLGAATTAVLYLLCRQMMGIPGSFAASFFWAFAPLPVALNRLLKEETPLTFFTLLACYFYMRAKQSNSERSTRCWLDLSAVGFGLSFASQYILHLFGLNALVWYLAGRRGVNRKLFGSKHYRLLLVMLLTMVLANPLMFSPTNLSSVVHWLHHDGIHHTGYNFDGQLYMNFPSLMFSGMPWYYYLWLLVVKTPIPILVAIILGSILLLRDRQSLASCLFLSLGVVQLAGLSVSGAKWIRYSLAVLPFLFLAAGYAVEETGKWLRGRKVSPLLVGTAAVVVFGLPLLELSAWAPYYSFYLNSFGGGTRNIARYFAPDEVSEFDTREVAQQVCPSAPMAVRLATARPASMAYYVERCGRPDIQVVPLYDPRYVPHNGDLIVLEPSRRFLQTQRYFDLLENSGMAYDEIHVGPVLASAVYRFHIPAPGQRHVPEDAMLADARDRRPPVETNSHNPEWASANGIPFLRLPGRRHQ